MKDYKMEKDEGWARIHKNCLWWPYLILWACIFSWHVCDGTSIGDADVCH